MECYKNDHSLIYKHLGRVLFTFVLPSLIYNPQELRSSITVLLSECWIRILRISAWEYCLLFITSPEICFMNVSIDMYMGKTHF